MVDAQPFAICPGERTSGLAHALRGLGDAPGVAGRVRRLQVDEVREMTDALAERIATLDPTEDVDTPIYIAPLRTHLPIIRR